MSTKPILCLDFDGVIHRYDSGWKGATVIPDEPVEGVITFLRAASVHWQVAIYSSRSGQEGGIEAMRNWLARYMQGDDRSVFDAILWPNSKPPAVLTLDDRAMTFTGTWPDPVKLLSFRPWNKQ